MFLHLTSDRLSILLINSYLLLQLLRVQIFLRQFHVFFAIQIDFSCNCIVLLHIKFIFSRVFALRESYLSIFDAIDFIVVDFSLLSLTFFHKFASSRANFIFLNQFNYVDDLVSFANVYSNNLSSSLLIAMAQKIRECEKNDRCY